MAEAAGPGFEIALDPHRPGRHRARVEPYGVAVWALIAHFQGVNGGSVKRTAKEYGLPEAAVRAAIAYYEADPRIVDAFLLLHREEMDDCGRPPGAAPRVGHQGKSAVQQLAIARETGRSSSPTTAASSRCCTKRGRRGRPRGAWPTRATPGILVIPDAGVLPAPEGARAIADLADEQPSLESRFLELNPRGGWREPMPLRLVVSAASAGPRDTAPVAADPV